MGARKTKPKATQRTAARVRSSNKLVSVDERGRVTLPANIRQGIESFALEVLKDGSIKLIPQEVINIADAALLKSLKRSVDQVVRGQVEDVPDEWID